MRCYNCMKELRIENALFWSVLRQKSLKNKTRCTAFQPARYCTTDILSARPSARAASALHT